MEMLQDYSSVVSRIPPLLSPLMQPFIGRVEAALSPGLTTLSWTALNTDACKKEEMNYYHVFADKIKLILTFETHFKYIHEAINDSGLISEVQLFLSFPLCSAQS